jgi:hypothetical protein
VRRLILFKAFGSENLRLVTSSPVNFFGLWFYKYAAPDGAGCGGSGGIGAEAQWLCQLSGQKAGVLDELAAERARLLDQESAELEKQAEKLAVEIKELNGEAASRIG